MNKSLLLPVALAALAGLALAQQAPAQPAAVGSPDYYPSATSPQGWRGDGSGTWPGATPVASWDSKAGKNIVWKTRMPAPSFSQPVVIGDRVITCADPNQLICVDANTGKILWQREVDPLVTLPAEEQQKVKEEKTFFADLFTQYIDWRNELPKVAALATDKPDIRAFIGWLALAADGQGADDPVFGKLLADEATKARVMTVAQPVKEYGFAGETPKRGDNYSCINYGPKHGPMSASVAALSARMANLREKYDFWTWPQMNWYANVTMTFATPVTDGTFIYVGFPQNQVACYDLNGTCKWLKWEHPQEPQNDLFHTRFVASPLLIGDLLIVNQNCELRAYNKLTGEKVWSTIDPYKQSRDKRAPERIRARGARPTPEGPSPIHVRLTCEGKEIDYVADAGGQLYRASDGVVVCTTMPFTAKGETPVAAGDLYVWKSGGDASPYIVGVCRLKAVAADKVECERLWQANTRGKGECTPMVLNGVIYDGQDAWEIETGKVIPTTHMGYSWNSPILAGDLIVGASGRRVGPALKEGQAITNVFEDDINTVDPDWDRHVYGGQCGTFGNSSPSASGNRLFFRTSGYLWCIGDPAVPYNWNPASRPAAVAAELK